MISRRLFFCIAALLAVAMAQPGSSQDRMPVSASGQMQMTASPTKKKAAPAASETTTSTSTAQSSGVVRTYYIAADEVDWDYTPISTDVTGAPHAETGDDESGAGLHHRVYHKAIYREYTDSTFKTLKIRPQQWEHLGLLGPLIRAEVGDSIRVFFRNNTHLSVTMHPHGVLYKKDAEGASYNDGTAGTVKKDDLIPPGGTYTYIWTVPERSGPAHMDGSSVLWMYHSHFVESTDINTGLVGPIIVVAKGMARADGTPKDVDREFIVDFSIFDETDSWFFEGNAGRMGRESRLKALNPLLREQNLMYSINGFIKGNIPLLTMREGEHVRWYLLSNSNEEDVHMAHWHGNTVIANGMRTDTVFLGPMAMAVADMTPDNQGIWLFHCHVNDHFVGGMVGRYQVLP